ncbi:MAG: hypothetical protein WCP52_08305 [Bacteroidota bacterium]
MKNIILISVSALLSLSFVAKAQNSAGKSEDMGRITLAAYVPQQTDKMSDAARNMLTNKLSQIVSQNGLGGSALTERFIITANIVTVSKDIVAGAPPMTALNLDITLYIGDGVEGTKFASKTISVKGVGNNETKAFIEGIKMIKTNDPAYATFLDEGKSKIMKYYNTKCDFIIKEAQSLATQNQQDEAIYRLTTIPDVCKECFDKCIAAVAPIYKQKIDRDCKLKLAEATNLWNANQDVNAANSCGELLSSVEPSSSCFKEVQALSSKIANRVKEIDNREWNYKLKEQQQTSEMIKAYRDVGVAYGNGQPKSVTYNVRGWW